MTGERMQITLVQLAAQVCIAFEASKIRVDGVFVPTNMLFSIGIYVNASEIAVCPKEKLPLGNNDPSWKERLSVRPGA